MAEIRLHSQARGLRTRLKPLDKVFYKWIKVLS